MQFCQENDLIIANAHFEQFPRRLYTWISNAKCAQTDFIIINRRFRNTVSGHMDGRDTRIIANLFWNQTADIRINGQRRSTYY